MKIKIKKNKNQQQQDYNKKIYNTITIILKSFPKNNIYLNLHKNL